MRNKLLSPLRIDFAGGWVDIPEFSRHSPGYVINVAISPYVYLENGKVNFGSYKPRGGISSSTGAIVLSSLKQIIDYSLARKVYATPAEFAEAVYNWENCMLNFKIGRQDQYAIVLGGLNVLRFGFDKYHLTDFEVERHFSEMTPLLKKFEEKLLLVHSGTQRNAQGVVEDVRMKFAKKNKTFLAALEEIAKCGTLAMEAVNSERFGNIADIMNLNWDAQKRLSRKSTTKRIDEVYKKLIKSGALGGKLCGAGGGGYFIFYCEDRDRVSATAKDMQLQTIKPKFEMRNIIELNGLNP